MGLFSFKGGRLFGRIKGGSWSQRRGEFQIGPGSGGGGPSGGLVKAARKSRSLSQEKQKRFIEDWMKKRAPRRKGGVPENRFVSVGPIGKVGNEHKRTEVKDPFKPDQSF